MKRTPFFTFFNVVFKGEEKQNIISGDHNNQGLEKSNIENLNFEKRNSKDLVNDVIYDFRERIRLLNDRVRELEKEVRVLIEQKNNFQGRLAQEQMKNEFLRTRLYESKRKRKTKKRRKKQKHEDRPEG